MQVGLAPKALLWRVVKEHFGPGLPPPLQLDHRFFQLHGFALGFATGFGRLGEGEERRWLGGGGWLGALVPQKRADETHGQHLQPERGASASTQKLLKITGGLRLQFADQSEQVMSRVKESLVTV